MRSEKVIMFDCELLISPTVSVSAGRVVFADTPGGGGARWRAGSYTRLMAEASEAKSKQLEPNLTQL